MEKVISFLLKVFNPSDTWRSAIGHAVVTAIIELGVPGAYGAVWYSLREAEQVGERRVKTGKWDVGVPDILDVLLPWVAVTIVYVIRWA